MNTNSPDPTSGRHFGMDWLRIFAFALLIFYHTGMAFVPWDWHVKWLTTSVEARLPMLALNGWRLSLLFVVSGYASAALFARQSRVEFLRTRSARLVIPTVFAAIFVIPPQVWIDLAYNHGYSGSFAHFWATDYFRFGALDGIVMPTWQHLWFVVYLYAYTIALLALHAALPRGWRAKIVALFGWLLSGPRLFLLPVVWIVLRHALVFPGVEDTHGLFDDAAAHWIYFPAFLFGMLLRHAPGPWATIRRCWRFAAATCLVATTAMLSTAWWMTGTSDWPLWLEAGYTIVRSAQSWLAIVALIGLADRYWNRDAEIRPVLNEAVFPCYIIHQTVTVVFVWYLRAVPIPLALAFALTALATALGCWLFYRVGREIPVLRLLIGLKGWRTGGR